MQLKKIQVIIPIIALGAFLGLVYNTYAGGTTVRYDIPLNIGESISITNDIIDKVISKPEVQALIDAKPCKIIATQSFLAKGEASIENGTKTSSWTDISILPSSDKSIEIKGVYGVVVITILYSDQSGYYIVYNTENGMISEPIFSADILHVQR